MLVFLQKDAVSCRKMRAVAWKECTFLHKNAFSGGAHGRKPQEIAGGFKGSRIKNASQLSHDKLLSATKLKRVVGLSHSCHSPVRSSGHPNSQVDRLPPFPKGPTVEKERSPRLSERSDPQNPSTLHMEVAPLCPTGKFVDFPSRLHKNNRENLNLILKSDRKWTQTPVNKSGGHVIEIPWRVILTSIFAQETFPLQAMNSMFP